MAQWAIHDAAGHVNDLVTVDPKTIRHPDLAKHYESVADSVKLDDIKGSDGKYTATPKDTTPLAETNRWVTRPAFFEQMTVAERKAVLAAAKTDTTVEDYLDWFQYGEHDVKTADGIADVDYFVTKSYISSATADKIKAIGKPLEIS